MVLNFEELTWIMRFFEAEGIESIIVQAEEEQRVYTMKIGENIHRITLKHEIQRGKQV